eukprot:gene1861-2198_t
MECLGYLQYKSSTHAGGRHHKLHKEKNWIPFIYKGELYFTQTLAPRHIVIKPAPDGMCTRVHASDSSRVFNGVLENPKGNTQ